MTKLLKVTDKAHERFKEISKMMNLPMYVLLSALLSRIQPVELFEFYKESMLSKFRDEKFEWIEEYGKQYHIEETEMGDL